MNETDLPICDQKHIAIANMCGDITNCCLKTNLAMHIHAYTQYTA